VISSIVKGRLRWSVGLRPEQVNPDAYHTLVLLVGGGRVFHLKESCARKFIALAAIFITTLVNCAVIERAYFCGHHFYCPESGSLNVTAAGTGFVVELAFIAFESACTQYHGFDNLMQFKQIPV